MTSTELWAAVAPPSSRLNLRVGMAWAVWGVALTNITFSSDPTIPQLFATLTAVKMLSPMWRRTKLDLTRPWCRQLNGFLYEYKTTPTSNHDAAKLCKSQDVNDLGTLRLYQVFHHQQAQEVHVFFYLPSVKDTQLYYSMLCLQRHFSETKRSLPRS